MGHEWTSRGRESRVEGRRLNVPPPADGEWGRWAGVPSWTMLGAVTFVDQPLESQHCQRGNLGEGDGDKGALKSAHRTE